MTPKAANRARVLQLSWSSHVPSNLFIWPLILCIERKARYLYWKPCPWHIQLFIKLPMFVLSSFLRFFLLLLFRNKAATRRKQLLPRAASLISPRAHQISLRCSHKKNTNYAAKIFHKWTGPGFCSCLVVLIKKNTKYAAKIFQNDPTVPLQASQGRWKRIFLTDTTFEKCSAESEIKSPHMRRRVSQALLKP